MFMIPGKGAAREPLQLIIDRDQSIGWKSRIAKGNKTLKNIQFYVSDFCLLRGQGQQIFNPVLGNKNLPVLKWIGNNCFANFFAFAKIFDCQVQNLCVRVVNDYSEKDQGKVFSSSFFKGRNSRVMSLLRDNFDPLACFDQTSIL